MAFKEAARGSCSYTRANKLPQIERSTQMIPDWAAFVIGASFGLMFVYGAVMF